MKKFLIIIFTFHAFVKEADAQRYYDSLHELLSLARNDTSKVIALHLLAGYFESTRPDSNDYYIQKTSELAEKSDFPKGKILVQSALFFSAIMRANYALALQYALNAQQIADSMTADRLYYLAWAHGKIGIAKGLIGDAKGGILESRLSDSLRQQSGRIDGEFYGFYLTKITNVLAGGKKDSAEIYFQRALDLVRTSSIARFTPLAAAYYGDELRKRGDFKKARTSYELGLAAADYYNNVYIKTRIFRDLTRLFIKEGSPDSAIYFGNLAIRLARKYHFGDYASSTSDSLARLYESLHKPDSALWYMKIGRAARDSIFSQPQIEKFQRQIAENEQRQKDAEAARLSYQNKVKLYSSLAAVIVFLLLSGILYRNNRQQKKANALLVQQRKEIEVQRTKAEDALEELKATQSQLVQREKMASLGELTAGVAHEIQNPLNFVNNFSEVNEELLDEMETEFASGNIEHAKQIAGDLRTNLQKVIHHGRRADSIVKGMLQHSQVSTGQKEATAFNALVEEFLRVSYHGQRARDISFHATIHTHLDESIGMIDIVPQDMGRVLQNLFNNAFYSVNEKQTTAGDAYQPTITVSTQKILPDLPAKKSAVELRIKDNGTGISEKIIGKIFQPFFTNKPTGQGTGLGLSLAYDIITKEHGGKISVETRDGEYAEFIILLPLRENN